MAVRGMEEAIIPMLIHFFSIWQTFWSLYYLFQQRESAGRILYFMTVELIKMVNILSKSTLNSSTNHMHMHNKKKSRWEEEFDNILWLWSGECNLNS